MKRIALLAGFLVLTAACSAEKAENTAADAKDTASQVADKVGDTAKDMANKVDEAASDLADQAHNATEDVHAKAHAALQTLENGNVMLVGTTGCGHCDYKVGNSCSAAVQTADGAIFILDGVAQDDELFTHRQDGMKVKVEGKLAHSADAHHIELVSYEKVM